MTMLVLNCPLCGGPFQCDDTQGGQQLACPHCQGLLTLPPLGAPAAPSFVAPPVPGAGAYGPPSYPPGPPAAPSPPAPPSYAPPGLQLGCPACGGLFQVTAEMAGMQVGCPLCGTVVQIPAEVFAPAAPPPGMAPMMEPPPPPAPPPPPQPATAPPRKETGPTSLRDLYPPGMAPPAEQALAPPPRQSHEAAAPPHTPLPAPPAAEFPATPPGESMPGPGHMAASGERPGVWQPERPGERTPTRTVIDSGAYAYPPGFEPPGSIAREPVPTPAGEVSKPRERPKKNIDALLPPGAVPFAGNLELREVPLPLAPHSPPADAPLPGMPGEGGPATGMPAPATSLASPMAPQREPGGPVLIPTEGGAVVALRETTKTVGRGYQERELRMLSSDEKDRRRLTRNVVMFVIGLGILLITAYILTR